jgi:hypothetical protein
VTEEQFGVKPDDDEGARVVTVDSKNPGNQLQDESEQIGQPDNTPDPTLVQPPFGAGPQFFSGIIGNGRSHDHDD